MTPYKKGIMISFLSLFGFSIVVVLLAMISSLIYTPLQSVSGYYVIIILILGLPSLSVLFFIFGIIKRNKNKEGIGSGLVIGPFIFFGMFFAFLVLYSIFEALIIMIF